MMKKVLMFMVTCSLMLAGCSQNEVFENVSESQMITFSNLNNKITKAANDALDDYKVFALWVTNKDSRALISRPIVTDSSSDFITDVLKRSPVTLFHN